MGEQAMTRIVPSDQIEDLVGAERDPDVHFARAIDEEDEYGTVYILHSDTCRNSGIDLRSCAYSIALDEGILPDEWEDSFNKPVPVLINKEGRLIPAPRKPWTTI